MGDTGISGTEFFGLAIDRLGTVGSGLEGLFSMISSGADTLDVRMPNLI